MKKSSIITAFLAVFMMVAPSKMSAQEDNGFKKFSVEEAFEDNGFQWFRDPQNFKSDVPKNMYGHFPAGVHSMYIGEVVNAWKK